MNTEKAKEVKDLLEDITALAIIMNEGKKHDPGEQFLAMVEKLAKFSQGPYYAHNFYQDARDLLKKHRDELVDELTAIRNRLNDRLLNDF